MKVFRIFSFVLLCVFISANIVAQNYMYKEEFDSERDWPINDNGHRVSVSNGQCYFENKKSGTYQAIRSHQFRLNKNDDFEMETSIRKIDGAPNSDISFCYEFKDGYTYKEFSFTPKGSYRIATHIEDAFLKIPNWKTSTSINQGNEATNVLKVRKEGSTISFYINEVLVQSKEYKNPMQNETAFILRDNQRIAIDYIRVKRINDELDSNTILYEGFTDNSNQWETSYDSNIRMDIRNGDYVLDYRSTSGGMISTIPIFMKQSKSYTIKTKIKQITGTSQDSYALTFQRKDNENCFIFGLSSGGSYTISQIYNGDRIAIQNWKSSPHIKKGTGVYNTLKVVKDGFTFKFYVNDHLLTSAYSSQGLEKSDIGFMMFGKQKVSVGFLSVKYNDGR